MSSKRVKYINQFFPINSYSFDSGNNVINVVANGHSLFTGTRVFLASGNRYEAYEKIATKTSANTFSVPSTSNISYLDNYYINGYLPGQTGTKEAQTLPRATGTETIVQSYVSGAGGASYTIDVSLDNSHWIPAGTITHATTDANTGYITISPGWAYMRANVVSIGANTNLVIMTGE